MKKTLGTIVLSLTLAAAAFAATTDNPNLPPPPTAQNYYLKGGKLFGSSRTVKDASGKTAIQYFDSAGRLAGTGYPYKGRDSGDTIVKYYDKGGKYLGYSSTTTDPDGEARTIYKMAAGMVFGTSVRRIDKASGDYITTYYYASGKLAGTSRRAGPKPQAQTQQATTATTTAPAAAASTAKTTAASSKTATTADTAPAAAQKSNAVTYMNDDSSPVLVPASKSRVK